LKKLHPENNKKIKEKLFPESCKTKATISEEDSEVKYVITKKPDNSFIQRRIVIEKQKDNFYIPKFFQK